MSLSKRTGQRPQKHGWNMGSGARASADCWICGDLLCESVLCLPCGHVVHEKCWRAGSRAGGSRMCLQCGQFVAEEEAVRVHGYFPATKCPQEADEKVLSGSKKSMCEEYESFVTRALASIDKEELLQRKLRDSLNEVTERIETGKLERTRAKSAHEKAVEQTRVEQQALREGIECSLRGLEGQKLKLLKTRRSLEVDLRNSGEQMVELMLTTQVYQKEIESRRASLHQRANGLQQLINRKEQYAGLCLRLENELLAQNERK
mmetsp:Transcript_12774/g.39233  ORF Transcript_12774/g.39233 Transcript_12774/m.39233 type:complete len:262 (-) Transcript_12774:417-1202(-)